MMYPKIIKKLQELFAEEEVRENGWLLGIIFFLIFSLSQSLFGWLFGEIDSFIVWMLLIVWSAWVAYILFFGQGWAVYTKLSTLTSSFFDKVSLAQKTNISKIPEMKLIQQKPAELSDEKMDVEQPISFDDFEDKIHKAGVLMSRDAMHYLLSHEENTDSLFERLVKKARAIYPRYDGWTVLTKKQILELLSEDTKNMSHGVKNIAVPANLPTGKLQEPDVSSTASFCNYLCMGDDLRLFTFVQRMKQGKEGTIRTFITETILLLDTVHAHRVFGTEYVPREVLENTNCFSNEEIEQIIAILMRAVDYRYTVPDMGMNIALLRALDYIKKHRKD